MTLTEQITARLDEWEAAPRDLIAEGPWQDWATHDTSGPERDDEYAQLTIGGAAVLGLVAGLRTVVALHEPHYDWPGDPEPTCSTCVSGHSGIRDEWEPDPWPCSTLAAVAGALGLDAGGAE